ncbi:MAG: hypothetical protein JW741_23235 [Sedimentisphaerales bacterium]|nr:hypothetical protein [Sedimentisphaerales bacterium]
MIDNISANPTGHLVGQTPLSQGDPANTRAQNDPDVALQVDFAGLIDKAKQIPQDDAAAVTEARKLLLSGELTDPSNVRSAAMNILKYGV